MNRVYLLKIMMVMGMVMMMGCDYSNIPEGGITIKDIYPPQGISCDNSFDICYYDIAIIFTDQQHNGEYKYYWPAIMTNYQGEPNDTIIGVTQKRYVNGTVSVVMRDPYWVEPNLLYHIGVFNCTDSLDGGDFKKINYGIELADTISFDTSMFYENCHLSCCSMDKYRYYVKIEMTASNITSAEATISPIIGERFCGENLDEKVHNNTFIAIGASGNLNAETGILIERDEYESVYLWAWYCAVTTPSIGQERYFWTEGGSGTYVVPQSDYDSNYTIDLDINTGLWTFNYYIYEVQSDPYLEWIDTSGIFVQFGGEIKGRETDMPGTEYNKCAFRQCRYFSNMQWATIDLYAANNTNLKISSDDINEWEFEKIFSIDGSFYIWDVNPMPNP